MADSVWVFHANGVDTFEQEADFDPESYGGVESRVDVTTPSGAVHLYRGVNGGKPVRYTVADNGTLLITSGREEFVYGTAGWARVTGDRPGRGNDPRPVR
ncbi:hypothetical protein CLV30_101221 [Haloactinopolyspora alba]|uniref:Uncharacterized protein n=1 Tax=Haloactinopolyspora alba TaxID=648780 RepID=A0A2P8EFL4_9ACTN|nr:hypothetical protein CLV30_101221 [Haloactinopolyspora alba]